MTPLTRDDVVAVLGRVDDVTIAEIIVIGASREELAEASAWLANGEPVIQTGRGRAGASPGWWRSSRPARKTRNRCSKAAGDDAASGRRPWRRRGTATRLYWRRATNAGGTEVAILSLRMAPGLGAGRDLVCTGRPAAGWLFRCSHRLPPSSKPIRPRASTACPGDVFIRSSWWRWESPGFSTGSRSRWRAHWRAP